MVVIAHDSVGAKANAEQGRQNADAVFDPGAAVLIAPATVMIDAAEEGPSDAARKDVVVGRLGDTDQLFAWSRHGPTLRHSLSGWKDDLLGVLMNMCLSKFCPDCP